METNGKHWPHFIFFSCAAMHHLQALSCPVSFPYPVCSGHTCWDKRPRATKWPICFNVGECWNEKQDTGSVKRKLFSQLKLAHLVPHFFVPIHLFCLVFLFFQTVLGVEQKSNRVSLSWHWRNSGTSAASDVGRATWFSRGNTSASECVETGRRGIFSRFLHIQFPS